MNLALERTTVTFDQSYVFLLENSEGDSISAFDPVDQVGSLLRLPYSKQSRARAENKFLFGGSDLLTSIEIKSEDPSIEFGVEANAKAERALADQQAYTERIAVLRAEAMLDGFLLSQESEEDFWTFIRSAPFVRKGGLVLMDNGNLRAVWKGDLGTHVGLQFLGSETVQYVIFKRRVGALQTSRVSGRDSFDGVRRQINAFDLASLIYT